MRRSLIGLLIFVGMSVSLTITDAAEHKADGTIRITGRSIAPAVGLTWGDGILTYRGKDYPFTFDAAGLSREVDVTLNVAELFGEVFNLSALEDFNGNYAGIEAGVAPDGGTRATIRNQNGVIINVVAKTPGIKFHLGPNGMKMELKK